MYSFYFATFELCLYNIVCSLNTIITILLNKPTNTCCRNLTKIMYSRVFENGVKLSVYVDLLGS